MRSPIHLFLSPARRRRRTQRGENDISSSSSILQSSSVLLAASLLLLLFLLLPSASAQQQSEYIYMHKHAWNLMGGGDSCDFFLLLLFFILLFWYRAWNASRKFRQQPRKERGKNADKWQKKVCIRETAFDILAEFKTRGFFGKKRTFYFLSFFPFCQSILRPPVRKWKKNPARQKMEETLTLGRRNFYFFASNIRFP